MSNSIAIPKRNGKARATASSSTSSGNNSLSATTSIGGSVELDKGKMPARDSSSEWFNRTPSGSPGGNAGRAERRISLLSSSISKSEHTVVNVGDPDGPPRLITCVKASQGFDWNQDIFLPSYASDHDYTADLERRQDPVEDIFISDEEAAGMFPRYSD